MGFVTLVVDNHTHASGPLQTEFVGRVSRTCAGNFLPFARVYLLVDDTGQVKIGFIDGSALKLWHEFLENLHDLPGSLSVGVETGFVGSVILGVAIFRALLVTTKSSHVL